MGEHEPVVTPETEVIPEGSLLNLGASGILAKIAERVQSSNLTTNSIWRSTEEHEVVEGVYPPLPTHSKPDIEIIEQRNPPDWD